MRKLFKFSILTLISVILISSIVLAYSRRADIIRSVSPELHFDLTLSNTVRELSSELESVTNNELISRISELFAEDFNARMELNLDAFQDRESRWYFPLPRFDVDITNSRWDRALAFGLAVEMDEFEDDDFLGFYLDLGAYFTNDRAILRLFDDSIFLNAHDPFDDIKAFSELNQDTTLAWVSGWLLRFFDNDISYDNIIRLLFDGSDYQLSAETIQNLESAYRNLFRSSRITVGYRALEFNGISVERDVTRVVVPAEELNKFLIEAVTLILNDEGVTAYFDSLHSLGFMPFGLFSLRGTEHMLEVLLEELEYIEPFRDDLILEFIESNGIYIGVVITMANDYSNRIEFGALGRDNMLDHIHFSSVGDRNTTKISLIGNNVRTNHFRSELVIENSSRWWSSEHNDVIRFTIDWNTENSTNNFLMRYNSISSWRSFREPMSIEDIFGDISEEELANLQEEMGYFWEDMMAEWSQEGWSEWSEWGSEATLRGNIGLTPARNIVAYLSSVRLNDRWDGPRTINLSDGDARITIRRFSGRVDMPQRPRALRNMLISDIEEIITRNLGELF
ncbi:MAG: hypothetical protein FWE29_00005 [Defluviitaleaceae bacterium]|nr:hypothetical protein [Defluviitaleaceae bacterium]